MFRVFLCIFILLTFFIDGCVAVPSMSPTIQEDNKKSDHNNTEESRKEDVLSFLTETVASHLVFNESLGFKPTQRQLFLFTPQGIQLQELNSIKTRDEGGQLIVGDRYDNRRIVVLIHGGGSEGRSPFFYGITILPTHNKTQRPILHFKRRLYGIYIATIQKIRLMEPQRNF